MSDVGLASNIEPSEMTKFAILQPSNKPFFYSLAKLILKKYRPDLQCFTFYFCSLATACIDLSKKLTFQIDFLHLEV